jgi:DMSO/TMAO reductase YedYZ molybdopterin-dependent catalytic subunit
VKQRELFIKAVCFIIFTLLFLHPINLSTEWNHQSTTAALAASQDIQDAEADEVKRATALLHITGEAQQVNLRTWRLKVKGDSVGNPLRLSYNELLEMEMVKRNTVLVCPGAFSDRADWEGVPLETILEMAEIREDFTTLMVVGLDGFTGMFSREEVEEHFIFLALKVNGVTLPSEHGFPVRIVAEDILGGKWVKWIDYIEVH